MQKRLRSIGKLRTVAGSAVISIPKEILELTGWKPDEDRILITATQKSLTIERENT